MEKATPRKMKLAEALIIFAVVASLIGVAAVGGLFPVAIGIFLALIITMAYGMLVLHFSFDELFDASTQTVSSVFYGLMFCMIVGFVSATWLESGTIQFLLYWGLELIAPSIFLLVAFVSCVIISFITGQAWTLIPTLGLAYIGIADALGISLPLAAAAIVSGCFFGDACSPLCEVPAIATSCAGSSDTMKTIRSAIPTKGVGLVVGAIFYGFMGLNGSVSTTNFAQSEELMQALVAGFNLSPLTLLPLIVVFVAVVFKLSPMIAVILGALVGIVMSVLLQGMSFASALQMSWSGYVSTTGHELLDSLLTRGGFMDFSGTIMMLLIAFCFAGVANKVGMLEVIVQALLKRVKGRAPLVIATTITTLLGVMLACSANVSSVLTGSIYKDAYREAGMGPSDLAREMSVNGSVFNAMLPWSASGALCYSALGVMPFDYWKFMIPFWVALVLNIVWAALGLFLEKVESVQVEDVGSATGV